MYKLLNINFLSEKYIQHQHFVYLLFELPFSIICVIWQSLYLCFPPEGRSTRTDHVHFIAVIKLPHLTAPGRKEINNLNANEIEITLLIQVLKVTSYLYVQL